jgi:hypothetical protein
LRGSYPHPEEIWECALCRTAPDADAIAAAFATADKGKEAAAFPLRSEIGF